MDDQDINIPITNRIKTNFKRFVLGKKKKSKQRKHLSSVDQSHGKRPLRTGSNGLSSRARSSSAKTTKKPPIPDLGYPVLHVIDDSSLSEPEKRYTRLQQGRESVVLCNWEAIDNNDPSYRNSTSELPSDYDSDNKVIVCTYKYENSHNLNTTSDSSDSDSPVPQQHVRKRKRTNKNKPGRANRLPPLESSSDDGNNSCNSNDTDESTSLGEKRIRGRGVPITYSGSHSNIEQTVSGTVNNSASCDSDVTSNSSSSFVIEDEKSTDLNAVSEKCPICFNCFGSKQVASPGSCKHTFCTKCIKKWAKTKNTCPIDRKPFNKITVHSSLNGEVLHEIPVKFPMRSSAYSPVRGSCHVCFSRSDSQNLISCVNCDTYFHLLCLQEPFNYIPGSVWNCPICMFIEEEITVNNENQQD